MLSHLHESCNVKDERSVDSISARKTHSSGPRTKSARCIPWGFRNGWRRNTKVTAVASYVRMRIVPGHARDSVARFDIVWSTRRVHCLRTVRIAWSDISRLTNINICGTINGRDMYKFVLTLYRIFKIRIKCLSSLKNFESFYIDSLE